MASARGRASRTCWATSKKASLSICSSPTGAPATSCRATSTWTTCPSPRSRWTRIRGRTRSWGRAMRRPSFLGPGPETDSESGPDEAALRGGEGIIAAGATGIGQAVERFGFRNAERAAAQVEQRVLPRIIGRPADAEQLIIRAGQRAQDVERAAAADIEQFAAEQVGGGHSDGGRSSSRRGSGWRHSGRTCDSRRGSSRGRGHCCSSSLPDRRRTGHGGGNGHGRRAALAGGAAYGLYRGGRWLLSGNGGDAASSSGGEFQDLRTLNNMQQGTPQEQQPRVQQPMVSRLNSSEDDAPMAQQQEQPRPQVRSRRAPQPRMPFGLNQIAQPSSSGSESYGPVRRPRPQRAEPSFNELRREALAREPEAA